MKVFFMLLFQSIWVQEIIWVMKALGNTLIRVLKNALGFFCITVHIFAFLDVPNELKELKLWTTIWDQKWACIIPSII